MSSFDKFRVSPCYFLVYLTLIHLTVATRSIYVTNRRQADEEVVKENFAVSPFKFASYYGSHMVLQRGPVKSAVWGYAALEDVKKNVTVTLATEKGTVVQKLQTTIRRGVFTTANVWSVQLNVVKDPGPYILTAQLEKEKIVLNDVLFGDVWICSGQSNMAFTVNQMLNSTEIKKQSVNYPNVRIFHAANEYSKTPYYDLKAVYLPWSKPDKTTLSGFSAVCYVYGTVINSEVGVPIGLIDTTWGGTPIEAWSSPDALRMCHIHKSQSVPDVKVTTEEDNSAQSLIYKQAMDELRQSYPDAVIPQDASPPQEHSVLWNAMVHPFLNMSIYGVLWYQGEQNANVNWNLYNCTFPAMISDWRSKFREVTQQTDPTFPFGFVQIGPNNINMAVVSKYCDIRWHQTADTGFAPNSKMPNTFMAVAVDLTDKTSPYGPVHYRDKNTTGHRVALSGLSVAYGKANIKYQGPLPSAYYIDIGLDTLKIEYDSRKHNIYVRNASAENGFEVCCLKDNTTTCPLDSGNWIKAPIIASDSHSVTVSFKPCDGYWIMGWRYVWRETPCEYKSCPVYSVENDLPAAPFISRGLIGSKEAWLLKHEMWKRHDGREWLAKVLAEKTHLRRSGRQL